MGDDACLQIHHRSQTLISLRSTNSVHILVVHGRGKWAFSHTCKHVQTVTDKIHRRTQTQDGGGGGWFQENHCIINCRAGYKGGRKTTMTTAATSLTAQIVEEACCTPHFIAQYLQLILAYPHDGVVNESVMLSCFLGKSKYYRCLRRYACITYSTIITDEFKRAQGNLTAHKFAMR